MSAHLLFDDEAGDINGSYNQGTGVGAVSGYGVTVNSSGEVNIDGLVQSAMNYLDGKMPSWVSQAVGLAAEWAGDAIAIDTALTAFAAYAGAGTVATGPFAPITAAIFAVPAILLAVAPASGGLGCCGEKLTSQQAAMQLSMFGHSPTFAQISNLVRFGSCSPTEWGWYGENGPGSQQCDGQWAGDHWTGGCSRQWQPKTSWEAFVGQWVISSYEQSTDCWNYMPGPAYATALATGLGVWNRAHIGPATVVRYLVNQPGVSTFAGKTTSTLGNPESYDPIPFALNVAAQKWGHDNRTPPNVISEGFLAPVGGVASFTVNTGPAWASFATPSRGGVRIIPLPQQPVTVAAPPPSGNGTALAVGAGTVAALLALKVAAPATFAKLLGPVEKLLRHVRR